MSKRITKECLEKINGIADLSETVKNFVSWKKSGSSYKSECPKCGSKDGLILTPSKNIVKCFSCGKSTKSAINFLTEFKGMPYLEGMVWLADKFNVLIEYEQKEKPKDPSGKAKLPQGKESFKDQQLRLSGLDINDIKTLVYTDDNTQIEIEVYQSATLNEKFQAIPTGDDMIMHYIDLDGRRKTFVRSGQSKEADLVRVRWQNPSLHLNKDGDPIKYQSPPGSGSAIWINNWVRERYKRKGKIKTLYIQEGEKKADKASKHGILSVGIMGIHNIASKKQLPHEFELLIKYCDVERVVFVLDSDWNDLSDNAKNPVDYRPKTFYAAVRNFKDYFFAFNNQGINLELYFAHILPNENNDKGIDDLLVNTLKGQEDELLKDFEHTFNKKEGNGRYINCYKISTMTDYQLLEKFHLESNEAFAFHHKDKLKERKTFKIGKELWKFGVDFDGNEILELAQPLSQNEQFWLEERQKTKGSEYVKLSFDHENAYKFLKNRGFYRYTTDEGKYIFVSINNMVVKEVQPYDIKDYLIEFTKSLGRKDLSNMIYRGARMYVGPESLGNLDYIIPTFHKNAKGVQFLFFQETFWRVTAEGIKEMPLKDLDGHVWNNKIIDFNAKINQDEMITVDFTPAEKNTGKKRTGKYSFKLGESAKKCHFQQYLWFTSNFYWEKDKSGLNPELLSELEMEEIKLHYLAKITAIGYLLHQFRDDNVTKAVVCMDGKMSEVNASNGRSGKSLFGGAVSEVIPTCYIPGKQKDLTDDKFLFEEVTEKTAVVFFDDVRVNLDFEFLFPIITGQMKVEGKGVKRHTLPREKTPKVLISTNHAINGDSASFRDRQFLLAFSDWYHSYNDGREHRPIDDFEVMFFTEWDYDQKNLFYNFMASCLKIYFQHGLIQAPIERLEKRRLRQQIGESMLEWAEEYFSNAINLRTDIPKMDMINDFYNKYPRQRNYIEVREFKKRIRLFCLYKDWVLNPGKPWMGNDWGGDNKTGGVEYIKIVPPDEYMKDLQGILLPEVESGDNSDDKLPF